MMKTATMKTLKTTTMRGKAIMLLVKLHFFPFYFRFAIFYFYFLFLFSIRYLRLRPETVLNLEELCHKRGIDPRPHRHMTTDQLLEYYDQLKERPATPVEKREKVEKVVRIWNRGD